MSRLYGYNPAVLFLRPGEHAEAGVPQLCARFRPARR